MRNSIVWVHDHGNSGSSFGVNIIGEESKDQTALDKALSFQYFLLLVVNIFPLFGSLPPSPF